MHELPSHGLWHKEHQTGTSVSSGQSAQQGGCRTGVPALHTWIFQPAVPGAQTIWRVVSGYRSVSSQSLLSHSPFQDGDSGHQQFVRGNGHFQSISGTLISMFLCPGSCISTFCIQWYLFCGCRDYAFMCTWMIGSSELHHALRPNCMLI